MDLNLVVRGVIGFIGLSSVMFGARHYFIHMAGTSVSSKNIQKIGTTAISKGGFGEK